MRGTVRAWTLAVIAVVVVAGGLRVLPLFTGAALPAGAARLHIETERPAITAGCQTALLSPVTVATSGDELVLVTVETGEPVAVVWPAGYAAWRIDGRAVIADPWGGVVGREGDVLDGLGGGTGSDDAFHICPYGMVTRP